MIPIEHIQFAGIVLTSSLTMMLLFLLPQWSAGGRVFSRSRWLMTAGTALLPIQFLLQYTLHFRQMGVTQAVMVNLLFFIPSAWLISSAVLNLLRQGMVKRHEWLAGVGVYIAVVAILIGANLIDGQPVLTDTAEMRWAELASAVLYMLMQFFYASLNLREWIRLKRALDNYYDHEKHDVIRWLRSGTLMLSVAALFAPGAIFLSGPWLTIYSVILFFTIFYCVISFYSYGVDHARQQVLQEAEDWSQESGDRSLEAGTRSLEIDRQRVERTVDKWLAEGRHLKSGITMQTACEEMNLPRYQLNMWLRTTEWELFSHWLTHLRIEEAKHLMTEHPDWSNDTIAARCGFNTRNYFHTVFRKQTGMTPAQFAEQCINR